MRWLRRFSIVALLLVLPLVVSCSEKEVVRNFLISPKAVKEKRIFLYNVCSRRIWLRLVLLLTALEQWDSAQTVFLMLPALTWKVISLYRLLAASATFVACSIKVLSPHFTPVLPNPARHLNSSTIHKRQTNDVRKIVSRKVFLDNFHGEWQRKVGNKFHFPRGKFSLIPK